MIRTIAVALNPVFSTGLGLGPGPGPGPGPGTFLDLV